MDPENRPSLPCNAEEREGSVSVQMGSVILDGLRAAAEGRGPESRASKWRAVILIESDWAMGKCLSAGHLIRRDLCWSMVPQQLRTSM